MVNRIMLVPSKQVELSSSINKEEFVKRFSEFAILDGVQANQWHKNIFRDDNRKYIGSLNNETFILEPLIRYSRNPYLIVKGTIVESNTKTTFRMKLVLPLLVKVVIGLMFFMGCFVLGTDYLVNTTQGGSSLIETYPILLVYPIPIYIIVTWAYNIEAKKFLKAFSEHFII